MVRGGALYTKEWILYYGDGYGLNLDHNGETGLSVSSLLSMIPQPTAFATEQATTIDAGIKKAIEDVSNQ